MLPETSTSTGTMTSQFPSLTAARLNTRAEFDRAFRSVVMEQEYQGRRLLHVAGLNDRLGEGHENQHARPLLASGMPENDATLAVHLVARVDHHVNLMVARSQVHLQAYGLQHGADSRGDGGLGLRE